MKIQIKIGMFWSGKIYYYSLSWCGIEFDEGPEMEVNLDHIDNQREKIYEKYAKQLVNEGKAYYAFDTPDELERWERHEAFWSKVTPV